MLIFGLGIGVVLILTLWLFLLILSIVFYRRGIKTTLSFFIIGIILTTIIVVWPKEKCMDEKKILSQEDLKNRTYYPIFFSLPLLIVTTITILFVSIKQFQMSFLKPFDNKMHPVKIYLQHTNAQTKNNNADTSNIN